MSGEITLKGKVLPVGGIKEKLLAAHREGIKNVILPADNKPDLKDMPKNIKEDLTIHFVETMEEVLSLALVKEMPKKLRKEKVTDKPEIKEPPITH